MRLIEYDPRNAAVAQTRATELPEATVLCGDAGTRASYVGAVPADLVLMVGVFGNITEVDLRRTIAALPQLCAAGATVIWTKSRHGSDRTPAVRAPADVSFSVGVHRFHGDPQALDPAGPDLFAFVGGS